MKIIIQKIAWILFNGDLYILLFIGFQFNMLKCYPLTFHTNVECMDTQCNCLLFEGFKAHDICRLLEFVG